MTPNRELITIGNNVQLIERMLMEMVLMPRLRALEFSHITKQTPNMKIGYPGQHLASLVTGMVGARTGARGNDIIDGSEVKSCSRVDQVDQCNKCGEKVARNETVCQNCGSSDIKRMDDSKWLFTIRSEEDLRVLTIEVPRVILIISDYPGFNLNNFDTIRFEVFEIWNGTERNKVFTEYMTHYYNQIYLAQKKLYPAKTPAPKNLFPYGYPFYMCNPTKVFSCLAHDVNVHPRIETTFFLSPDVDRSTVEAERLPTILLEKKEITEFIGRVPLDTVKPLLSGITLRQYQDFVTSGKINPDEFIKSVPFLNEAAKAFLPSREVGGIRVAKEKYSRNPKKS